MNITKKKAILIAAVILVLVPTSVVVLAQPSSLAKQKLNVRSLPMGEGFALNPQNANDYHVLDISVIATHRNNSANTIGRLRFANQTYGLNVTKFDNQSLTGDVVTLPPRGTNRTTFTPTTVGHIALSTSRYEGALVSTGTLTMNNTNYNVFLRYPVMAGMHGMNIRSGMHGMMGNFGYRNSRMRPNR